MSIVIDRTADTDFLMDHAQWVRAYPAGRKCKAPGCGTILSIYNSENLCGLHAPYRFTDPAGEKRCRDCGQMKPRDEFCADAARPDRLRSCCKSCRAAKDRDRDHHKRSLRKDGKPDAIQVAQRSTS